MDLKRENIWPRLLSIAMLGLLWGTAFTGTNIVFSTQAMAQCPCTPCACCCGTRSACSATCANVSTCETNVTVEHITQEFLKHREWLVTTLWNGHVLPSMMKMTEQMTAVAMQQVMGFGMILDAKHQLETQRLLQNLQAQAHKDYQPSEGMCEFGTNMRSLAASERNAEFTQMTLSNRYLQRQLLSGDNLAGRGPQFDSLSRYEHFQQTYCNKEDSGRGLDMGGLCKGKKERFNKDVDYTQTLGQPVTLEVDFTPDGVTKTDDEEDIFALSANMYGNTTPEILPKNYLGDNTGQNNVFNSVGGVDFMEIRSLVAKRSVAQNSFAAIAGMKAQGGKEVEPYIHALLLEMGIPEEDVKKMLRDKPSYYAQMELLTKKLYQYPAFYTNLYDKPVNVARKDAAMRAIGSIQQRDIFRSLLRSESIMSVWLETEVQGLQEQFIRSNTDLLNQNSDLGR